MGEFGAREGVSGAFGAYVARWVCMGSSALGLGSRASLQFAMILSGLAAVGLTPP